jgi:outer membrane receptor protein involved in Fe transport
MKIKNLFLFFGLLFITGVIYADNPGEVVEETAETPEVVEESTETSEVVEETVQEETSEESPPVSTSGADDEVVELEKVIVTGSRIKKTQVAGPLPLIVITKEDIDNKGFRNLTEALQSVPTANASTQNESLNINFTPNANELDLRNLGPGRILYLVNGRRTADYPIPFNNAGNIANIGIIPSGLVDRVEILSQGASAIYGSDAVTGVVNVITIKGKDYQELDFDISQTEYENANIYSLSYTAGGFFGNTSWTIGADYSHVDPMTYADRPGHDSFVNDPDYGVAYTSPRYGMVMYTGAFGGDQRSYYGSSEFPGTPSCEELSGGEFFDFDKQDPEWLYAGSMPGRGCGWDYGSERFGGSSQTIVNERDDIALMATLTHNFDSGIELNARIYSYYDEAFSRGSSRYFYARNIMLDPTRIMELTATSTDPYNVLNSELNPYASNQQLGMWYFLREFAPSQGENFDARRDYTEEVNDVFFGLSGFFNNGFEWEFGINSTTYDYEVEKLTFTTDLYDYMYGVGATDENGNLKHGSYYSWAYDGQDRLDFLNSIGYFSDLGRVATTNDALSAYGLPTDPVCGTLQFGRYQPCFLTERLFKIFTNDEIAQYMADDSLLADSSQTTVDFVVNGEFELAGRFVGMAAILEHSTQDYQVGPNRIDPNIEFIQGVGYDGGGERDRTSAGVELLFPVTDKLEMTLATRYDSYDDESSNVGSRMSSMMNFAYRPTDNTLIRGSYSQTFRAPDMNYLFAGLSSGFYNGVLDYVACYVSSLQATTAHSRLQDCELGGVSVQLFQYGNTELEEEEGENIQLGFVWDINDNWDFSLDLYQVILEEVIGRESYRSLNIEEGYCLYGEAFTAYLEVENIETRDCDLVYSKIGRAAPEVNPIDGTISAIGEWEEIYPDYINQSFKEYQGLDWTLNYSIETENAGDFSVGILSSHIIAYYSKTDERSDEIEYLSYYTYEPRSQQNMSINWRYQDFSTTLFMDRLGHMELGSRGKTDPHITANLTTFYNFSPDLNLFLSIRNLEDKMPQTDSGYGYPYYNRYYFSAFGRYVSAGFNFRF